MLSIMTRSPRSRITAYLELVLIEEAALVLADAIVRERGCQPLRPSRFPHTRRTKRNWKDAIAAPTPDTL